MLLTEVIGYLGSDAEVKNANGREFTAFRVANSDRWTDQNGQQHEQTTWVDCVMTGVPGVKEYLRKGTLVYIVGNCQLRVYSSPKDKCMKAGMQINVIKLELLGGKTDEIPSRLIVPETGQMVEVQKYYGVAEYAKGTPNMKDMVLVDERGNSYSCTSLGWVSRIQEQQQQP